MGVAGFGLSANRAADTIGRVKSMLDTIRTPSCGGRRESALSSSGRPRQRRIDLSFARAARLRIASKAVDRRLFRFAQCRSQIGTQVVRAAVVLIPCGA